MYFWMQNKKILIRKINYRLCVLLKSKSVRGWWCNISIILKKSESVSGRVPRALECELRGNLVGSVINGDIVTINGILRTELSD